MRSTNTSKDILKDPQAYVYPLVTANGVDLTDRVDGLTIRGDMDSKGWTCEVSFVNHPDLVSLIPYMGGTHNETLKAGKPLKVWFRGTLTKGDYGTPNDLVFDGVLGDDIVAVRDVRQSDTVTVRARSKWKKTLQDTYVLDEKIYPVGARGANPWEVGDENSYDSAVNVASQILSEHLSVPPTVRVVHDPNYSVYPYMVAEDDLWTILQNLFLATGFDLSEKYYATTDSFELVLSDPLLAGGTEAIAQSVYRLASINFSDTDVRNLVRVYYRSRNPDADILAGAQEPPNAPDGVLYVARSVAPANRAMKVVEDEMSLIDTYAEAYAFAGYILDDLKDIQAKVSIDSPCVLYFLEPYDKITLSGPISGTMTITAIEFTVRRSGGRVSQGTKIDGVIAFSP